MGPLWQSYIIFPIQGIQNHKNKTPQNFFRSFFKFRCWDGDTHGKPPTSSPATQAHTTPAILSNNPASRLKSVVVIPQRIFQRILALFVWRFIVAVIEANIKRCRVLAYRDIISKDCGNVNMCKRAGRRAEAGSKKKEAKKTTTWKPLEYFLETLRILLEKPKRKNKKFLYWKGR